MNKRIMYLSLVAVLMFLLVPVGSVWAYGDQLLANLSSSKGNIRKGNLRLHLGLDLREAYDDNIYNTAVDEKEDFITSVTPGALVTLGTRHKIELGYAAGIHTYNKYSTENFVSQHGRALVDMKFPSGIRINFMDIYLKTEDPRPEELQLRASHWTNDIDASLGYEFPAQKLMVELLYSNRYLKYDQAANKAFNKSAHTGGIAVYYKVLPKTAAFIEYRRGIVDYYDSLNETTDKDAKTQSISVGLKWDATAKLSGTIKTGWTSKRYDNVRDAFGNVYVDQDLWSLEGQLSYRATEKTTIIVLVNRSLDDTEYSGSAVYSRATNYLNTGGTVGVEHKVLPKLTVGLSAGLQKHEYNRVQLNRQARSDEITDFGIGLSYELKDWLRTGIKYEYSKNDSDDPSRDERHNKVFVSLTATI